MPATTNPSQTPDSTPDGASGATTRSGGPSANTGRPVRGPKTLRPIQAARFFRDPFGFMAAQQRQFGDVFEAHIADEKPWIVLSNPEHVKQVFTGSPDVFHAGRANSILLPLLGDHSVLLLDGKQHLRQRKLLLPAFHGERMASYGEVMRQVAEQEVASWPIGAEMQLAPHMQDVTLEVIMRAVFGMEEGAELDHVRRLLIELLEQVMRVRTFIALAVLGPYRFREIPYVKRMLAPATEALYAEFARRRQVADLAERTDILSLLMQATDEDGQPLTDEELRDELITLLVAGHETTATSLSWAVERLIRNPAALHKLRDDLDAGSEDYLDAVIKETLRLRPVIPVVVRDVQEDVEIGGFHIPKNSRIACSITLMHRNPEIYPDPEAFRPERFLDTQPGTYTWIPFGGGVRRCLGASFALFEMKQVLPAIIQELELAPVNPAPERIARRLITLTPGDRTRVRVQARRQRTAAAPVTMTA